jgi:hypothetical protein
VPDEPPSPGTARLREAERAARNEALIQHALARHRRRHRGLLGLRWGVILVGALAAIWQLASSIVAIK